MAAFGWGNLTVIRKKEKLDSFIVRHGTGQGKIYPLEWIFDSHIRVSITQP